MRNLMRKKVKLKGLLLLTLLAFISLPGEICAQTLVMPEPFGEWRYNPLDGSRLGDWHGRVLLETDQPIVAIAMSFHARDDDLENILRQAAIESSTATSLYREPIFSIDLSQSLLASADFLSVDSFYDNCNSDSASSACNQDSHDARFRIASVLSLQPPFQAIPVGNLEILRFALLYSGGWIDADYGPNTLIGDLDGTTVEIGIEFDPLWSVATFSDATEQLLSAGAFIPFPIVTPITFQRGDADGSGNHDLTDVIVMLLLIFEGQTVPCLDAADATDDGLLDLSDPVLLLEILFGSLSEGPAPWNACGTDPTADPLACAAEPSSCN